ncbi:MAG: hypothetical protein AB1810_04780 [Pseudomonadota bacterium]
MDKLHGLVALLLTALAVSACTPVRPAETELMVSYVPVEEIETEQQRVVSAFVEHRDGCFSARNAEKTVVTRGGAKEYRLMNQDRSLELRIAARPEGKQLRLTLSNWTERRFRQRDAVCYQEAVDLLKRLYGPERVEVRDECPGGCVR